MPSSSFPGGRLVLLDILRICNQSSKCSASIVWKRKFLDDLPHFDDILITLASQLPKTGTMRVATWKRTLNEQKMMSTRSNWRCHIWYNTQQAYLQTKNIWIGKVYIERETLGFICTNIFLISLQLRKRLCIAGSWPWKFRFTWKFFCKKFWQKEVKELNKLTTSWAHSAVCGRSKPQLNTQRKRQKSREEKKTFGKERRSSENIGQRTSSSAVCYCAIFGTAALPDAHSSLLSNVGLVFSLLLSLNQGRPTFRPEDSFTIDKIFFS